MQQLKVSSDGSAQYTTIQSALDAARLDDAVTVYIYNGVYREKLVCSHPNATLVGESRDAVLLTGADGGKHFDAQGQPLGTFRSQTALFDGERICVKNMTIANTAGDGRVHGQALAAAVYSAHATFENVDFVGCQDTLFTGPLPEKERLKNGFLGKHQFTPRIKSGQYYKNCSITGDIDFIFGGADALFENCAIHCRDRGEVVNGYVTAPSTAKEDIGYVFYNCKIDGTAKHTFYLGRPWRKYGKAAFISCEIGAVIMPDGFDDWQDPANRATSTFAEYANKGDGAKGERAFGKKLSEAQAQQLLEKIYTRVNVPYAP